MARWVTLRRRGAGRDAVDRVAVDDWRALTLTSDWVTDPTFGGATPGYYRDPWGRVFLRGTIETSGNVTPPNTISTLPKGYRPEALEGWLSWATGGGTAQVNGARLNLTSAGVLSLESLAQWNTLAFGATPYAITRLGLDGLSFRVKEGEADERLQR